MHEPKPKPHNISQHSRPQTKTKSPTKPVQQVDQEAKTALSNTEGGEGARKSTVFSIAKDTSGAMHGDKLRPSGLDIATRYNSAYL